MLQGLCRFSVVTYVPHQETGWSFSYCMEQIHDLLPYYADINFHRLIVGQSLLLRRVVPILGVPDALVPVDLPVSQINLFPGYLSDNFRL